jgi:cell division septation protein DedD
MIGKHIYHLLVIEDSLVLPKFGTFSGKKIPAEIQAITNKFSAAKKEISFLANDIINDNKLIQYIAKKENISNLTAGQNVKIYIYKLKKELEENKKASIPGVGAFSLDSKNNIVFQVEENINFLAESFGKKDFDSPAVVRTSKEKTEKTIPEKKQKKEKQQKKKPKKTKEKKRKKKKRGWLWLLIIVALLSIGAAVWYYVQPEKVKNIYFTAKEKIVLLFSSDENDITIISDTTSTKDSTTVEIIDTTLTDSIVEDSVIIEENINEADNTVDVSNNNQNINNAISGKFYIVGGCFGNQSYANNLVNQLKADGYSSFILDKSNGLFRVTYGGWDTEKQAEAELTEIKQAGNNGAWILEY